MFSRSRGLLILPSKKKEEKRRKKEKKEKKKKKDDTIEPKKRKETRTKPTKMARKKSTLRMTRTTTDTLPTYNFYYTLATVTKSQSRGSRHGPHATRSCPASNREGGDRRPGVASPRRTRALARCTQHESTVYQRRVSSEGSSLKFRPTRAPSAPSRVPAGVRWPALVLLPKAGATLAPPQTRGA